MSDELEAQIRAWAEDNDRPIPIDDVRLHQHGQSLATRRAPMVLAAAALTLLIVGVVAVLAEPEGRSSDLETVADSGEEDGTSTLPPTTSSAPPPETTSLPSRTTIPSASPPATVATTATTVAPTTTTALPPRPVDHGATLRNRSFRSTSVTQNGQPRPIVEGTTIDVQFANEGSGDLIRWLSGCNRYGGDLTISVDRINVVLAGGTQAGCEPARAEQERWVNVFFQSDPFWRTDGTRLRLTSGDTVIELEEFPFDAYG